MPVTVTVTDPALVKVHERVEVPDPPETEEGVKVHEVLSLVRVTVAVKPFNGEMVIVEVPGDPVTTDTADGLADIEKSAGCVTE